MSEENVKEEEFEVLNVYIQIEGGQDVQTHIKMKKSQVQEYINQLLKKLTDGGSEWFYFVESEDPLFSTLIQIKKVISVQFHI